MRLKKFALRGLIALAVVVALCMFFARTVQTITTPKVQIITAENGRFEEKLSYSAQVYFEGTETVTTENPYGMAVSLTHVQPGEYVTSGDVIFTLELPGYSEKKTSLQTDYNALSVQLMELDAANYGLTKEADQRELYDAMLDATRLLNDTVYAARLAAISNGVTLSTDVITWDAGSVPAGIQSLVDDALTAQTAYDEACAVYHDYITQNPGSEAIFAYVNARDALLEEMGNLSAQMLEMDLAMAQSTTITAPHAGYVAAMDAASLSYTLCYEDYEPVLRCLAPGKTFAEGARVDVINDTYGTERSSVTGTEGSFVYVSIPKDLLIDLPAMAANGVQITIANRAKQSTTLLPVSALRGSNDEHYVYQIEYVTSGILAAKSMKVVKVPVNVIQRSNQTVSIAENLEGKELAIREDRALTDGQPVMQYVN